jgi:hypothetical protein
MKLFTDFVPHFLQYGIYFLVALFVLVLLLWVLGLTFSPFVWITTKLLQTRCPECKGFFKKNLVDLEISDKREVLRTVNRVDQGVLYSNNLLALNHGFEINRQEQVTFVEETLTHTWQCKDPGCGHKWQTEGFQEIEGKLDN